MKCESVILDLKLRRWKEVRCGQARDELARGARSSCASSGSSSDELTMCKLVA